LLQFLKNGQSGLDRTTAVHIASKEAKKKWLQGEACTRAASMQASWYKYSRAAAGSQPALGRGGGESGTPSSAAAEHAGMHNKTATALSFLELVLELLKQGQVHRAV